MKGALFGSAKLDGGQAEYVRIPYADGTVMKAPSEVGDQYLVLMADIFPTGYFGAQNAFKGLSDSERADATVVVVGCGPVGLCAIIAAQEYKPKHIFAVDSVDSRLEEARKLGAEPLNFVRDKQGMLEQVMTVTEGRGADAVIEVVGLSPALRTAFDLIRPWGVISSIGVHNAEVRMRVSTRLVDGKLTGVFDRSLGQATRPTSESPSADPLNVLGLSCTSKNIRLQMGRCPVRSMFPEALALLAKSQDKLR